jgi:uncharacterized protein (DUF302 family)
MTQSHAAAEPRYGWTRRLPGRSLAEARARVTEALREQGFGILTEIDVAATLKQKLGRDFRPYVILGACNPSLAHRALEAELAVGLLLPCNVCLWEDDGAAVVAIARPDAMFEVAGAAALRPVADEVQARLEKALAQLAG